MLVGYALVSTDEQNPNLQRDALQAAGCEKIFEDQISGAKAKRPGLQAVLQFAGLGDTLMIWRLDRLSRSLKDLIDMVKLLELNSIGLKSLKGSVDTFPVPGC
ncbi:recombinase family protein [Serratia symbiotica]|uniref:recombinase family protein n=1 Tax=Serratia symbiotica TaxID=138074 RepID=UPI00030CF452|nr:recombinase family protein [Serratia symbiotica]